VVRDDTNTQQNNILQSPTSTARTSATTAPPNTYRAQTSPITSLVVIVVVALVVLCVKGEVGKRDVRKCLKKVVALRPSPRGRAETNLKPEWGRGRLLLLLLVV
jgi:hypothetical protein